jgi:uncharacterized RDD family membrane protein YckC
LFDFLTTPFEWFANVVQYSLIFMAIIILVLTIGAVVAIPIGLKLLGVAFAKTIVVETSKVVRDLGLDKIKVDTDELKSSNVLRFKTPHQWPKTLAK